VERYCSGGQAADEWRICIACGTRKAASTHSEYVTIDVFSTEKNSCKNSPQGQSWNFEFIYMENYFRIIFIYNP
jgi:hypothetical protein